MAITLYKKGSKGEIVKQIQKVLNVYPDGIFGSLTESAVKDFQRKNNLKPDGIVGPATFQKLGIQIVGQSLGMLKKSKRTIDKIIVHCTATPPYMNATVSDIRRWHKQQGWSDIGYHYVIYLDGSVHEGRDINIAGAHCSGYNQNSIGVVYVGGVDEDNKTPKDTRTPEQRKALLNLLKELKSIYPKAKIYGHRNFSTKACPSFDAKEEYKNL